MKLFFVSLFTLLLGVAYSALPSFACSGFGSMIAHLYERDSHVIRVNGPLNTSQQKSMKTARHVYVEEGADVDLFSDQKAFPKLFDVILNSTQNAQHLRNLATNYPGLRWLSVSRSESLNDASFNELRKFRTLEYFSFHGDVATPTLFAGFLPVRLQRLCISDCKSLKSCESLMLPNLESLEVHNCQIIKNFLRNVKAEKLSSIDFSGSQMQPDGMSAIGIFSGLKSISLAAATMSGDEFRYLKALHHLRVLNLENVVISPSRTELQEAKALQEIASLDLEGVSVSDMTADWALALQRHRLKTIHVCGRLSPVKAVLVSGLDLERLSLQGCCLEPGALKAISRMNQLKQLDLSNTDVTGSELGELSENKSIEVLRLIDTKITSDDLKLLPNRSSMWIVGYTRTLTDPL